MNIKWILLSILGLIPFLMAPGTNPCQICENNGQLSPSSSSHQFQVKITPGTRYSVSLKLKSQTSEPPSSGFQFGPELSGLGTIKNCKDQGSGSQWQRNCEFRSHSGKSGVLNVELKPDPKQIIQYDYRVAPIQ